MDELLGGIRLLRFDEFHVHDPGDTALSSRLLWFLFGRGVTLLTTSNHPPSGMTSNPL
ncbi:MULTISPECIES: AFG1/ZapE family ATPase [Actinosynnema]|uniref:AFG1/ZapE family ATPase n=1 Tax=Actinosynnema TaxID=40566 RepID=UPI0020A4217C|nr:AFG1/ZapE family ATPase [Actinosynnema pretiosum]MCP2100007.1 AFG1-like ATPase [Actinosynnema pretiosum]